MDTPVEKIEAQREATRSEFVGELAAGVVALSGLGFLATKVLAAEKGPKGLVERMQEDVRRALKKPIDQRRWAMGIDMAKCIGCKACTVACRAENKTPPNVTYRPVFETMEGKFPNPKRSYLPRPCMHCEKPACLAACPKSAIKRRPDGVVFVDYETCTGERACIPACPYEVPEFDEGGNFTDGTPSVQPYELAAAYEMGTKQPRVKGQAPIGRTRKCTYCVHRLESGMLPACTTTCIGHATYFGDLNDPESLIAELAKSPRVKRLKEEAGTRPTTFYLS